MPLTQAEWAEQTDVAVVDVAAAENLPSAQTLQSVSAVVVPAVAVNLPAAHTVWAVHAPELRYCVSLHVDRFSGGGTHGRCLG